MRGINETTAVTWNGEDHAFAPGVRNTEIFLSGIHANLPGLEGSATVDNSFSYALDLNGSESADFTLLSDTVHQSSFGSYVLASVVTVGLIIAYSAHFLERKGRAVLLIVLGLLTFTTRKIDWYHLRFNRTERIRT
jgi:inner membrane protein involved in colicin E2 resistance